MNYIRDLQENPEAKPTGYWKNTSDNAIIRSFIDYAGSSITRKMETLLSGGYIVQRIEENLTYDYLHASEENLWSILYLTGYLTREKGIELPEGLKESDKLPEPIYTPSTKAEIGDHDENISYEQSVDHLEKYFPGKGKEYADKLREYTIALYKKCAEYALEKGIIIADTKFEFGLDENGNIVLGDEMLTPDSSRFWPAQGYEAGHSQPSFDKQFARDWLTAHPGNDWTLPQEIVDKTIEKYLQSYEMLTGEKLA